MADPSYTNPSASCNCHGLTVAMGQNSLHTTLKGIRHSLVERGGGEPLAAGLETTFHNHCARCHSSCGDCHFSTPQAAGGGLLAKHMVKKTPPMNLVCTACHGSRVSDEYKGANVGFASDTHYNRGFQCTRCHSGAEMHGSGAVRATHRYQVETAPRCEDCHPDNGEFQATGAHTQHRETDGTLKLSCQVCHSVAYKHCDGCHVQLEGGKPVFEVNAPTHLSKMAFKIGYSNVRDARHPARWVTLRHAPAAPGNYDYYGAGLMSTFDANPTWRLATPHNIQRQTPQNANCTTSCHGQRELFLAPEDVDPLEAAANQPVVVPDSELP